MEFEDYLKAEEFNINLLDMVKPIYLGFYMTDKYDSEIDFENHGSNNEIRLKKILNLSVNLSKVLKDIDYTFLFLEKKKEDILEHYPMFDDLNNFYNYHYENYFIRLVTLGDIIGRLGNQIYETGLDPLRANPAVFRDKARSLQFENIASITNDLVEKLADLKYERHRKLHAGESEGKAMDGVVFWEDISQVTGHCKKPKILRY